MLTCLTTAAGAEPAARQRDGRISAFERWMTAIDKHVPGETDRATVDMARLTPAQRDLLLEIAVPFAQFLQTGKLALRHKAASAPEAAVIEALKTQIFSPRASPSEKTSLSAAWLHRAVIFETDIAILSPDLTAEAMRGAHDPGVVEAIHSEDGELGGREMLNWHFGFARELVDARDPAASDAFAVSWYHAVALYQLNQMLLGELEPHLRKGVELFRGDARIQFDSACLSDAFGSTRVQSVLMSAQIGGVRPNIPTADVTRAMAMRQFGKAIELDLTWVEPRVRLARLYEQAGRHDDALALLATAFKLPMSAPTEYMAQLVAGRADGALGHVDDGVAHLKAALELFPSSQTPLIAMSHIYLMSGDLEQAGAMAAALRDSAPGEHDDPWWSYFPGAWLGASALLDQLRDQVRR